VPKLINTVTETDCTIKTSLADGNTTGNHLITDRRIFCQLPW